MPSETTYTVQLTQQELNDIWRAKLMLDHPGPDNWTPAAIRAVSKRIGELVARIKMSAEEGEHNDRGRTNKH